MMVCLAAASRMAAQEKEVVVFIRIIATPPGEAPDEVRRAWLGLELPLADGEIGPRNVPTGGVITGPRTFLGKLWKLLTGQRQFAHGYVINAPQALVLLAEKAPSAALWWRECAPHCWQPGQVFLFPAEVCVEVLRHKADRQVPSAARTSSDAFSPAGPTEVTPARTQDTISRERNT